MTADDDLDDLKRRQAENRAAVDTFDRDSGQSEPERKAFFRDVYAHAAGDAAFVPWADLRPKPQLLAWLDDNPGNGERPAIDIACGLGDNAEALSAAGYRTVAFDLSDDAIAWARRRFPESTVDYRSADLFALPDAWRGAFDLVHECYTLQSLPPAMLDRTAEAVAGLVKPGGTLLVYARWRPDGAEANGPPWPLEKSRLHVFEDLGFQLDGEDLFSLERPGRQVPHSFAVWRKT